MRRPFAMLPTSCGADAKPEMISAGSFDATPAAKKPCMPARPVKTWIASFRWAVALTIGFACSAPASAFEAAPSYGQMRDNGIVIPGVPTGKVPQRFHRQVVRSPGSYPSGTVVVDPANHFLYLIEDESRALRYGVSVGKGAFAWSGKAVVARSRTWPRWTPPAEMIARSPNLKTYGKGLEGGLFNPLGARAFYLHQGGRDTLYRIHGTSEWWSIGDDASSGCIRLLNQDIVDLAQRVSIGTPVVVLDSKTNAFRRKGS